MVYEESATNLRPRMYLDSREKPANVGDKPSDKKHLMFPEPMAHPVEQHRMIARVAEKNLENASGRRVTFKNCIDIITDCRKHG
jgi:hypothetical protein